MSEIEAARALVVQRQRAVAEAIKTRAPFTERELRVVLLILARRKLATLVRKRLPSSDDVARERFSRLTREIDAFDAAVINTGKAVDACFNDLRSGAFSTTPAVFAQRQRAILAIVSDLDHQRLFFVNAAVRARNDNMAPIPDATEYIARERQARLDIDRACARDAEQKALASAQRCGPDQIVPPRIREFLDGRLETRTGITYLDKRVYCYTGDEGDEFPGVEIRVPFETLNPLPDEGQSIGGQGFIVVVKEGRYFAVGYPERRKQRKQRLRLVSLLKSRLAVRTLEIIAASVRVLLRGAVAIASKIVGVVTTSLTSAAFIALHDMLQSLVRLAWKYRTQLLVYSLKWVGATLTYLLFGNLLYPGVALSLRLLAKTAAYVTNPLVVRTALTVSIAVATKAYYSSDRSDTRKRELARRVLVSSVYATLASYTAVPQQTRNDMADAYVTTYESYNRSIFGPNANVPTNEALVWRPDVPGAPDSYIPLPQEPDEGSEPDPEPMDIEQWEIANDNEDDDGDDISIQMLGEWGPVLTGEVTPASPNLAYAEHEFPSPESIVTSITSLPDSSQAALNNFGALIHADGFIFDGSQPATLEQAVTIVDAIEENDNEGLVNFIGTADAFTLVDTAYSIVYCGINLYIGNLPAVANHLAWKFIGVPVLKEVGTGVVSYAIGGDELLHVTGTGALEQLSLAGDAGDVAEKLGKRASADWVPSLAASGYAASKHIPRALVGAREMGFITRNVQRGLVIAREPRAAALAARVLIRGQL